MIKHFCDKCGKELPLDMQDNVKIGLWQHYIRNSDPNPFECRPEDTSYKVFHYDLCNDCAGKVTEYITGQDETEVFLTE